MDHLLTVIGGPRECLRVDSLEAYVRKVREIRVGHGLRAELKRSNVAVPTHVSDGRWVFDCPCGSAGLASHEWGIGICVDCGTVHKVSFPADRETVEAVLLERPVLRRHYFADEKTAARRGMARPEKLDDLEDENHRAGLGLGPRAEKVLERAKRREARGRD